ncbi:hypothetical protein JZ751_013507 [Albula glossodonta]|uniref:Hexosyltransferase n=1 Tax=Albula glossodonta TaxID=121402 RepID=A0A8T2MZA4_9TELE|nr:hypothetical protein JZ751_013507 [Albula glossodonta]
MSEDAPSLFASLYAQICSVSAMVLRRFRRSKVVATASLTCAFVLICIFSLRMEHPSTVGATKARAVVEVVTDSAPKVIPVTPNKKKSSRTAKPQPSLSRVVITESFRKAIPQNSAFWNRKQHALLKQLDSAGILLGNDTAGQSPCSALSLELLKTNIQDFSSYPPLYQDFLQGMDCRDPPILIDQPEKCSLRDGARWQPFLLLAIKSIPRNFERRQAVRDTWGREASYEGGLQVRTVFLLGTSSPGDPNLGELLRFEAQHFGDLLQWDFRDSFYNLTLKENAFLGWASNRCPHAAFIFKGDDDVFMNPKAMIQYLRSLDPVKASKLYMGQVVAQATPFRDSKSKYYVPHTFYDGPYPTYAGGGGFVFSGSLLRPLHLLSHHIASFPIDDVYTGMCFQALGIAPEGHPGFQTFDIRELDRENACAHKGLFLVHQRTPQQVIQLWKHMHSPLLTC